MDLATLQPAEQIIHRHRPAGPDPAALLHGDRDGRPAVSLRQQRRHRAHEPLRPALAADDEDVLVAKMQTVDLLLRLPQRLAMQLFRFRVRGFGRRQPGLGRVLRPTAEQMPDRLGSAQASAGIEPRHQPPHHLAVGNYRLEQGKLRGGR